MKKMLKALKVTLVMLVSAAMVISTGCGIKTGTDTKDTSKASDQAKSTEQATSTQTQAKKETWKIGFNLALTGAVAATDAYIKEGAEVAVKDINAAGGIHGRMIEIVSEDNQTNPTTAVTTARKLAENKDIIAILGPSFGTYVLPTIPIYEEQKVTDIAFGSSLAIVEPIKKYVYKIPMSDYKVAERLITFLADERKVKKIAILHQDDTTGNIGRDEVEKRAKAHGLEITVIEKFATTATDMRPQLMKINQSGAEALVVWGSPAPASVIAKNIKELGMKQIICGSHGIAGTDFLKVAGSAANGWYFYAVAAVAYKNLPSSNPYKQKIDSFAPKLSTAFDAFHGNGHDAICLLAEAIKNAGPNATRDTVRDALEKIKDFQLLLSTYTFESHDGQTEQSLIRFTVKNNEFWPD